MIDSSFCYHELKTKSVRATNIFHEEFNSLKWLPYHSFEVSPLSRSVIENEPALRSLDKEFKIDQLGFLRINSNRCYKWHVDGNRGVAINMLVTPSVHSYCLFGDKNLLQNIQGFQTDILELKYSPDTFYVFNTQWPHTVLNFEAPRYLLSIEFVRDKNSLTYNEVKEWVISNNL
jgi:hypothetical protein